MVKGIFLVLMLKSERYGLRLETGKWKNVVVMYKTVIRVVVIPVEKEGNDMYERPVKIEKCV